MNFRNTVLIADNGSIQSTRVERNLREKGVFSIKIEALDSFVPLRDSLDRIRAVVVMDGINDILEKSYMKLKILKAMAGSMPLLFSTAMNTPQKETRMRDFGLFYYHTEDMGQAPLMEAIDRAVKKSVESNRFL